MSAFCRKTRRERHDVGSEGVKIKHAYQLNEIMPLTGGYCCNSNLKVFLTVKILLTVNFALPFYAIKSWPYIMLKNQADDGCLMIKITLKQQIGPRYR